MIKINVQRKQIDSKENVKHNQSSRHSRGDSTFSFTAGVELAYETGLCGASLVHLCRSTLTLITRRRQMGPNYLDECVGDTLRATTNITFTDAETTTDLSAAAASSAATGDKQHHQLKESSASLAPI